MKKSAARWLLPLLLLALLWANFSRPIYAPPSAQNVRLRLNYLERVIREGLTAGPGGGRGSF
jgi:hypothetical protein